MTLQQIKDKAPEGATHYSEYKGGVFYFFRSSYGFRQIKENLIQFDDANMKEYKPL